MENFRLKISSIKNNKNFNNEQLFLIDSIDNASGFLLCGNKVYFVLGSSSNQNETINTSHLTLKTNVHLNTIENFPTFKPDFYDLVIYNTEVDIEYLETFVSLCTMYRKSDSEISLQNFFYSLLKIFEPEKQTSFANLIGVFGELFFLRMIYEKYGIRFDKNWHNSFGCNDKYDFSFKNMNIEIKTSAKEGKEFLLKHSQIFNEKNNYIAVVNITPDNSGESLNDLYNYFRNTKPFTNNIEFMINLEKEKQKVSQTDFHDKKFSFVQVSLFDSKQIDKLSDVPQCINSINYNYDFVGQPSVELEFIVKRIEH